MIMKVFKYIFTLSLLLLATGSVFAQEANDKYLAGAVPEVDGRVVFAELIHLPNASKAAIFEQAEKWIENRYNSKVSRVLYKDLEAGMLVAFGSDTLVFKESFLSLDRAIMTYQLKLQVKDGECGIELEKVNYAYGQSEKFTAEEMISDKVALNKSKTKVIKGLQKWRYKTVDHVDALFNSLATSLAVLSPQAQPIQAPIVTAPKREKVIPMTPISTIAESSIIELPADILKNMDSNRIVVSTIKDNQQIDVAIESIQLGKVFGETTVSLLVAYGSELYTALETSTHYTIRIYTDNEMNNAKFTISCSKIISQSITPESITDSNLRTSLGVNALQKLYIGRVMDLQIK